MDQFISEILFLGQRFNQSSLLDIALVTVVIFIVLNFIQSAQANTLVRGTFFILILFSLFYIFVDLPAFTWLLGNIFPSVILIVPVIYAPEIRRSIERIGRIESIRDLFSPKAPFADETAEIIPDLVPLAGCCRLVITAR